VIPHTLTSFAGLVLLAGCGGQATACTDIGAASGVQFDFKDVLHAHPGQGLLVRACVRDTCDDLRVRRHSRQPGIVVGSDVVVDGSPVRVSLRISTLKGDAIYNSRVTAIPVVSQPNGPGCPPIAWMAAVSASGTQTLQQTNSSG
jgi:hypothetical protein